MKIFYDSLKNILYRQLAANILTTLNCMDRVQRLVRPF